MRRRRKQDGRWNALWLWAFLAAFHPNCSRCCPDGATTAAGCSCKYAWEPCPTPKGCETCSTRATSTSTGLFEAGTQSDPVFAPDVAANPPGGTIAFVASPTGAFVVSSIPALDRMHVVHLEATKWDEDPLTIRTIGDVALEHGDEPGRVVASQSGNVHAILRRGGAVVAIDPKTAQSIERTRICAEPRGLAYDRANDLLHAACASGEIVTLSAVTQQEVKHRFVSMGLEEIAVGTDVLVATTRSRILRITADGTIDTHEARGAIGAVRSTSGDVALAFTNDNASFATMTREGTIGPFMAVRPAAHATSDLDVASDATVAIVSDGDAFVLARGAAAFEPVGQPGIARAIAVGEIATDGVKRRVIAVQTDAPRMLVFFDLLHPTVMLGFETM